MEMDNNYEFGYDWLWIGGWQYGPEISMWRTRCCELPFGSKDLLFVPDF